MKVKKYKDCELAFNGVDNITVIKLQLGQKQDDEIKKLIQKGKTLGIVAKKVSQARLESFSGIKIKLLDKDPINNFTELHETSCLAQ